MSDLSVRLILILAALLGAVVSVLVIRTMNRRRPMAIDPGSLASGVYMFSSASCLDCLSARSVMTEILGAQGFVEFKWEEMPDRFRELAIEAVPATVIVADDGTATLFPGMPTRALRRLNP